jgi:hypothetical protein
VTDHCLLVLLCFDLLLFCFSYSVLQQFMYVVFDVLSKLRITIIFQFKNQKIFNNQSATALRSVCDTSKLCIISLNLSLAYTLSYIYLFLYKFMFAYFQRKESICSSYSQCL